MCMRKKVAVVWSESGRSKWKNGWLRICMKNISNYFLQSILSILTTLAQKIDAKNYSWIFELFVYHLFNWYFHIESRNFIILIRFCFTRVSWKTHYKTSALALITFCPLLRDFIRELQLTLAIYLHFIINYYLQMY